MAFWLRCRCTLVAVVLVLWPALVLAAGVKARMDTEVPAGGPFPSDLFTVVDASQKTGRRVNLPKPDCAARPSDCADIDVLNTLDGFNLQPRLSIPFDGPVDPRSVDSGNVFLVSLGGTVAGGAPGGKVVGINQVVWDPATSVLHVESDELLEQHTRYLLVVTRGVRDASGDPAEGEQEFRHDLNFGQTKNATVKAYRKALLEALKDLEALGIGPGDVIAASLFTTQSATAVLERIRDQLKAATPAPARFDLGPLGRRTVFPRSAVGAITFARQGAVSPDQGTVVVPVIALNVLSFLGLPNPVGTLAFGKYQSPDYRDLVGNVIPPVPTAAGVPQAQRTSDIHFTLFLPAGPKPPGGWPVAIFGHGFGDNKNNSPFAVAAVMGANGIATIAINAAGHGFGAGSTLTTIPTIPPAPALLRPVTFPAGGRGVDQNGDGRIESTEGLHALAPQTIIGSRDGLRQTVVDLMQLVRVIEVGMDVDGDQSADLDPSRIYYFGQSLGGIYGTVFLAVEPSVRAGVPNVPGGPLVEVARLSRTTVIHSLLGAPLAQRIPSLLNDGPPTVADPFPFIDNLPLRNQPPVTSLVPGAIEIQQVIEHIEWVAQSGSPVAYAPHLRKVPLVGVLPKSVIVQFGLGDQTAPNPTTSAILRAGDLADRATLYRADLAVAQIPTIATNPHGFLVNLLLPDVFVALAAQAQITGFFGSDGAVVLDPDAIEINGVRLLPLVFPIPIFEVPIVGPLPEDLGFLP